MTCVAILAFDFLLLPYIIDLKIILSFTLPSIIKKQVLFRAPVIVLSVFTFSPILKLLRRRVGISMLCTSSVSLCKVRVQLNFANCFCGETTYLNTSIQSFFVLCCSVPNGTNHSVSLSPRHGCRGIQCLFLFSCIPRHSGNGIFNKATTVSRRSRL